MESTILHKMDKTLLKKNINYFIINYCYIKAKH